MPDFWQFPTVSLGIGPITSIYQARFMKYLQARGMAETEGRKVWTFCGDGEMDEPDSMGAIGLAGRERLDNLIWVINCNLQRLDGPVRGNGKIIQDLEAEFRGAGWNVIKAIWGSRWDPLLAADTDGALVKVMEECVDGEYQTFKSHDGAYVREHFFGRDPRLLERVVHMSDEEVWLLNRGGLDQQKVYAAYHEAVHHTGQPTVILAKTIKGYGMGVSGEGQMITHQAKKMTEDALLTFRDRFELPLTDEQVRNAEYYKPPEDSPEMQYLRSCRAALGGSLPARRRTAEPLVVPGLDLFQSQLDGTGEREISTTMAFVRVLAALLRDKAIADHIVPIVPDESRTFGMEGMFRQLGIYSPVGQLYQPQDSKQLMFYKEDAHGQILEEGITEAGSISSFIAAGTSYSTHAVQMVPFYAYYSMFGYQRVGDLVWAAGDSRTRGFMLGGTAGRTTLNGEGLQHEDGHSHVLFSVVPNCRAYDPTFGYEVAVIVQDGLHRMLVEQQDAFYYITLMNENYHHPAMPAGAEEGILRGMYLLREGATRSRKPRVQLLGSGAILREVMAAADLLGSDWGVDADVWSVTSFTELRRDGIEVERWNMLHPAARSARRAYVTELLDGRGGPVIASTDYIRAFADQIRQWVPGSYRVLGTDGFGRSDYRRSLRRFFEVDRHYVTVAALKELADAGQLDQARVQEAIERYGIDTEAPIPTSV
jgi:pyruvate dehydrogenase E1 component